MKVYTKTGDKGTTSLFGGARVSKSHIRIESYGTVDELNSYIGLLKDQPVNQDRKDLLENIQDKMFTIGAILATEPGNSKVKVPTLSMEHVSSLEEAMDKMDESLPAMKNFVLPGGHQSVSYCHITRCICRRAERLTIALNETEPVDPVVIQYLNRLSDYFFVLARKVALELDITETPWHPNK
ncbi:cob(I)yrinic acid a,c-diamide adenosyltransferase [Fulvivirga sp. M361]|uniref:cob(I)yrinic acid a,c-diamide adenosyltransferase n=1 Tax=Fulvivirga sp. M361 TaxID=2594266 RepID=UPI00117AAA04|nr:cob(I)yrinic acid a,c-diamide adenosyltransferase [Fulvivirga sp. M361]TRX57698.1 cob(I)yrinic acid a,c-diamide adenosyltransferase [Fulvivirga sp. M361]